MGRVTRSSQKLGASGMLDEVLIQRKPRSALVKKTTGPISLVKTLPRHLQAVDRLKTAEPDVIVCRQVEVESVTKFVTSCISRQSGSSLYITGSPGTGKTISVESSIKQFRFPRIYINALTLPTPASLYQRLYVAFIEKQPQTLSQSVCALKKYFSSGKGLKIVVIDELDGLLTSSQDVLYQLFQWAHAPNSKLILIGIANAAELTDRHLPLLEQHDIFPERLAFAPYTHTELSSILKTRLQEDCSLFHPFAAELLARKVAAASSGDARKFLDLCRKAVIKSHSSGTEIVAISTVANVIKEALDSGMVDRIRSLPSHQQIVLCLLSLMLSVKQGSTSVGKFQQWYMRETKRQSLPAVRAADFIPIIQALHTVGLVDLKVNRQYFESSALFARAPKAELQFAFKDINFFSTLLLSQL